MKIKLLSKKYLIIVLSMVSAITILGIKYIPKYAKADSLAAEKIYRLNKMQSDASERANQANIANPNIKITPQPMIPDPKLKVERIPSDIGWGIGWLYNGPYNVSELWIAGDKPDYEHNAWNTFYAYSGSFKDNSNQGFIGTFVMNGSSDNSSSGNWKTPGLWGSVKITNINGNIVNFVTDSGINGTFNLNTHEWNTK